MCCYLSVHFNILTALQKEFQDAGAKFWHSSGQRCLTVREELLGPGKQLQKLPQLVLRLTLLWHKLQKETHLIPHPRGR